jgi:hypothetical protein
MLILSYTPIVPKWGRPICCKRLDGRGREITPHRVSPGKSASRRDPDGVWRRLPGAWMLVNPV